MLTVTKVNSVEGDVSVNVRKGRIRQIYDLSIDVAFAHGEDGDEQTAHIGDFMSDTDFAGFEVSAGARGGAVAAALKEALWPRLLAFRREVEEVQGKSLLVDAPDQQQAPPAQGEGARQRFTGVFDDKDGRDGAADGSVDEKIEFMAPRSEVFAALTDPAKIMAWSRGTAQLSAFAPGASFSLLNGNIVGSVAGLREGEEIRMEWRLKHWPDACASKVVLSLSGDGGACVLRLQQTGIPTADVESVRQNWHRYYWEPIKSILGCTSVVF